MKNLTPFELQVQGIANGTIVPPSVSTSKGNVPFSAYQVVLHHAQAKLLAAGLKSRNLNISDLKHFYGIKGNAASIAEQIGKIKDAHLASLTEK